MPIRSVPSTSPARCDQLSAHAPVDLGVLSLEILCTLSQNGVPGRARARAATCGGRREPWLPAVVAIAGRAAGRAAPSRPRRRTAKSRPPYTAGAGAWMDGPTLPAAMMTLPAAPGVARPREPQLQSSMNQPWLRFTKRTHTTARRTRGSPKLDRTKAKRVYYIYIYTAAYTRAPHWRAPIALWRVCLCTAGFSTSKGSWPACAAACLWPRQGGRGVASLVELTCPP